MDLSFLVPGEVETRGSTQYVGKPLPQCKPSTSRRDATSEKIEKIVTQIFIWKLLIRFPVKFFIRC